MVTLLEHKQLTNDHTTEEKDSAPPPLSLMPMTVTQEGVGHLPHHDGLPKGLVL